VVACIGKIAVDLLVQALRNSCASVNGRFNLLRRTKRVNRRLFVVPGFTPAHLD
jgi:hypothetical protein